LGRPFGMNLEAAMTHGEVEFGLELSQHGEADITEGSNEVGEHRDVNRHRFCSLCPEYMPGSAARSKGTFQRTRRCNFLGAGRLC
ncbi:MAG TPA: hypothetical protein VNF49_01785, partial [Candidatus Binataceae bacterium]|nr:hypothetical protein [Candidatus Binataceae bacterium]